MGKVSSMDKMRIQTVHEQRLGAKAIMIYGYIPGQELGPQHSEVDLRACWSNGVGNRTQSWFWSAETNTAAFEELICSQEGETSQHYSSREVAAKLNVGGRFVLPYREAGAASSCIFRFVNIDDLERPWTLQKGGFGDFFHIFWLQHIFQR